MTSFWNFFTFFITQAFIGYSLALGYYYLYTRKKHKDFLLVILISFFGVFAGGLWEVFYLRPRLATPEYYLGFQYLFPTISGLAVLFLYGMVRRIKDN